MKVVSPELKKNPKLELKALILKRLKVACGRRVKHVLKGRSDAATDATFKAADWLRNFQLPIQKSPKSLKERVQANAAGVS